MKLPKFTKREVKRRTNVARTRNGGEWTEARFNSFVKGALRGAMWPPKYACFEGAFVGMGINPATKRRCKMYRCAGCEGSFPLKSMKADHIEPVVGPQGFVDWNTFIARLFVEKEGFQVLCKTCHDAKSEQENAARRSAKKA